MRVFITGGTGFIGGYLTWLLRERGHEALPQSRRVAWEALEGCDAVVNLAGANIAKGRWTARRKAELRASRVDLTRKLVETIAAAKRRPKVLVSGSATGFYGDRGDEVLTEASPPGAGFLAELCRDWEKEANYAQPYGVRVAFLRTAVVLGAGGGALPKLALPFKLFVGGPIGRGAQWMSWIAREDLAELILFLLSNEVSGPVNAASPNPVRNKDFARELGAALRRPSLLPAPKLALRLALGEVASELTASQRVLPKAAEAAGFKFRLPELPAALRAAL